MSFQTSFPLSYLSVEESNAFVDFQQKINDLLNNYTLLWENGEYVKIKQSGYLFYGLGADALHQIVLKSKFMVREAALFGEIKPQLKDTFSKINKDKSEMGKMVKDSILNQLMNDLPVAEAQKVYEALVVKQNHPIFSFGETIVKSQEKELDLLMLQYVTCMTFGISSDFLGTFRPALSSKNIRQSSWEDIGFIKKTSEELEKLIEKTFKKIYSFLTQKKTAEQLVDPIVLVKDELEGYFQFVGTILGLYIGGLGQLLNPATKLEAYKTALKLNNAINNGIVLYSYLNLTIANLKNEAERENWLKKEQGRTLKREYKSHIPQGRKLSIKQVSNETLAKTGAMVQVEGQVKSIEIRDDKRPPKFSTFVVLQDIQTNDVVTLRAHMFGLEDNGVAVGSYLKVNGFVVRGEHWLAAGETGMDIDRVNFTELSKTSWMDDLTFRMKDFFPLYKDGMNMTYTLN